MISFAGVGLNRATSRTDVIFNGVSSVRVAVRLIRAATSLGGVESLVERRAWLPGEERVPAGLLRFSVGLEDPEDLWRDLVTALV